MGGGLTHALCGKFQPGGVADDAIKGGVGGRRITGAVLAIVRTLESRTFDRMYPIAIFDALRVKISNAPSPIRQLAWTPLLSVGNHLP
jgi:hypothetical protein